MPYLCQITKSLLYFELIQFINAGFCLFHLFLPFLLTIFAISPFFNSSIWLILSHLLGEIIRILLNLNLWTLNFCWNTWHIWWNSLKLSLITWIHKLWKLFDLRSYATSIWRKLWLFVNCRFLPISQQTISYSFLSTYCLQTVYNFQIHS